MAIGTRDELWAMYWMLFGPQPSPLVGPDDENAYGEKLEIPVSDGSKGS